MRIRESCILYEESESTAGLLLASSTLYSARECLLGYFADGRSLSS